MPAGPKFGEKSVPRGTLVWNGIPQYLVSVENYFLSSVGNMDTNPSSSILSIEYTCLTFLM